MPLVTGGIQAATGIAKTVTGLVNNAKAKKAARELERTRPKYEISDLAGQDLSLAESELGAGGLSSSARTAYNNLNNQQFSSSLNAILKGGGTVNNIGDVFGASEEGRQRLALLEDQMRLSKINNLTRARTNMMEQEDKAFQFNQYAPWADKAQATAVARQQAQNDIWGGVETVANAGMQTAGTINNQNRYDAALGKYFNNQRPSAGLPNVQFPQNVSLPQLSAGRTVTPGVKEIDLLEYGVGVPRETGNFEWLNVFKR